MLLRILGVQVLALTLAQDRFEVASEILRTSGPGGQATCLLFDASIACS
jgi:hypothetical protein